MKLRALLNSKRYTPAMIAPKLGISDKTIYSWIYGRCTPSPVMILKLAEILEVSEKEILECFKK